jgi:hypothetical protein
MTTKILILTPSRTDACSFYRSGGVFPQIVKNSNIEVDIRQPDQIVLHWQILITYDIVMLQRPFSEDMVSLANYVKGLNIPLWVEFDDNLLAVPADNSKASLYNAPTRENIKTIMQLADVISVTTKTLKDEFAQYCKNIVVIPNAFNDFIFKGRSIQPQRQRMFMWRGGESHIYDIMTLGNAYNRAMSTFRDWQFLFMGFLPWYLNKSNNFYHLEASDIIHYFNKVGAMRPTALTVPLHDNIFNRCKSNIASIEATYFGAVCIAPAWPEWNIPGTLLYENENDFFNQLQVLVKGYDGSQNVKMAWDYITTELLLSKVNKLRVELIGGLL